MTETSEITKVLLKNYGRTLADDFGVDAHSGEPRSLFWILIAALLLSARIGHGLALKSARILFGRGWTTAEKMAGSTWQQRLKALDEGGYVRYDERTSTMARPLKRRSRSTEGTCAIAGSGRRRSGTRAEAAEGIQRQWGGWHEYLFPRSATRMAGAVRLPPDARKLASLVRRRRDFVRLVNALMQVRLEGREEKFRALAAS